jgi:hypothetical protein
MEYILVFLISVGIYIIGEIISNYSKVELKFFIGWVAGATALSIVLNFLKG